MPRTARVSVAEIWYQVLNRGNRREALFHKPADYDAFVKAMADANARLPADLLGYCLMPNHFHLVIRTHADGDLGRWLRWLLVAHAQRYHRHYHTTGHVWQGWYKTTPTMFKSAPRGGANKRGWTDPIDDPDLVCADLDVFDQGANDLALVVPGRGA